MPKIWLLPSVKLSDRARLPRASGIYYAIADNEILYIGLSTNLYLRWNNTGDRVHHKLRSLPRHTILKYRLAPKYRLEYEEAIAIQKYDPPLNEVYPRPEKNLRIWLDEVMQVGLGMAIGLVVLIAANPQVAKQVDIQLLKSQIGQSARFDFKRHQ